MDAVGEGDLIRGGASQQAPRPRFRLEALASSMKSASRRRIQSLVTPVSAVGEPPIAGMGVERPLDGSDIGEPAGDG